MTNLVPQEPKKKPKIKLPSKMVMPLFYAIVAISLLILGVFIPGLTDEIILESIWIVIVAGTEIKKKIDASKK